VYGANNDEHRPCFSEIGLDTAEPQQVLLHDDRFLVDGRDELDIEPVQPVGIAMGPDVEGCPEAV
jgi:hypothetical protein